MTIPALILAVCVLIGCGVQWRRNVLALRQKVKDLTRERDELREFVATVQPEMLPEIDA